MPKPMMAPKQFQNIRQHSEWTTKPLPHSFLVRYLCYKALDLLDSKLLPYIMLFLMTLAEKNGMDG